MAGALIVEGLLESIPLMRGIRECLLLLKAIQIENGRFERLGIGQHVVWTVNGQENPVIALRPGGTELWRIADVTADLYYRLSLDGHAFGIVASDEHRTSRVERTDTLVLSPGSRAEVLVRGGARGAYVLRTGKINTGPAGKSVRRRAARLGCRGRKRRDATPVDVPIRGAGTVVIPFTNPTIVGRFPFHCHILSHDDRGMMATIEVVAPR
jgi:FtsP/CotA-like multicopper oxidase with cupredoxin domain